MTEVNIFIHFKENLYQYFQLGINKRFKSILQRNRDFIWTQKYYNFKKQRQNTGHFVSYGKLHNVSKRKTTITIIILINNVYFFCYLSSKLFHSKYFLHSFVFELTIILNTCYIFEKFRRHLYINFKISVNIKIITLLTS